MSRTFDKVIAVGIGLLAALLTGNAVASFFTTRQLNDDAAWVAHTHEVIDALRDLSSTLKDAETGQRDYLLTGEDAYLDPYRTAASTVAGKIDRVEGLTVDNPGQQESIPRLREVVAADLDLLGRVADLRNDKDADPARRLVPIRQSRAAIDAVNAVMGEMDQKERDLLRTRQAATDRAYLVAVLTGLISDGVGLLAYVLLVWLGLRSLQARARAAARLRHERELLHATLSSIGDGVIAADAEGRVTFLNAVAEGLTGWATAEAARRPIDEVFRIANELTREPVETPVARVLREGNVVGLANHTVLLARDGTVRPIDDSAAPIKDGRGGVSGVVLVFRDVAERREAERRRNARLAITQILVRGGGVDEVLGRVLQAVCDNLGWDAGHFWRIDPEAGVLRCEQTWRRPSIPSESLVIASREKPLAPGVGLPGRVWSSRKPTWVPDVLTDPHFSRTAAAAEAGFHGAFAIPVRLDAEMLGVVEFFSRVLREPDDDLLEMMDTLGGQIGQFIERKRAEKTLRENEERLRLAQEAGGLGSWEWNIASNRVHWSPSLEAIHGLAPGAFPGTFEAYQQDVHPDDREFVLRSLRETLEGGKDHHLEYRLVWPDASVHWVEARGKLFRDESGKPVRMVGVCMDATERKRDEERLHLISDELGQRNTDLAAASRHKDEFLAMLAHELRNPLAPIRNALYILRAPGAKGDDARRAVEMMERQVENLVRLVDDLLDVSRITRGKVKLQKERIDLAAAVRGAVETARPLLEAQGHQFSVALPAEPVFLEADQTRLEQVLANLLNNAAKYTERGGRIRLSAEREGGEVVVRVRDTGIGIPADLLPRVFDLFTQAERSLDRSQGGLGIGLALVKSLVEMHGGRVEAHSEGSGRGSEFVVRLPALPGAHDPYGGEKQSPLASRAEPRSSRRVLVVDDNRDAAESLMLLLRLWGHEVQTAHDGPTALEAARSFRPGAVLLDIGLPGMTGCDVAVLLRQEPGLEKVLLVAVSGYGQEDDRRRTREAGFDAHLVKPADPDALYALLNPE